MHDAPVLQSKQQHYRSGEALTHAAFHKPPKHNQCITVKQCLPVPGAGSESTTVTVNNSTQPVCNVSTVYRHQRPDQQPDQEYQRHAGTLQYNIECP